MFDRFQGEGDEETDASAATDGGDPFATELDEGDDPFSDDAEDADDAEPFSEKPDEYAVEELERRIDDIEAEFARLSSTVGTIKSENEEIGETVDTVEENVRKLLDVYEMVTQGINPFVDEIDPAHAYDESGSLGLFGVGADDGNEPITDADGTSFDDLKAEYESDGAEAEGSEGTAPAAEGLADGGMDADLQFAQRTLSDDPNAEKPYLRGLPDGYVADLLILEWLEYLVDAAGHAEAEGAIDYYETIEWIDETGADQLRAFIAGFGGDSEEGAQLTTAHHTQSLRYICRLSSSDSAPVVLDGWTDGSSEHCR
nr:FlaD/FlaE family flagellar protein [Halalkalicoccus sp. NIPERK01]